MRAVVVGSLVLALAGCLTPGEVEQGSDHAPPAIYVPVRPATFDGGRPAFAPGGAPLPVFLNRNGGTYTSGNDDASNNVSSVVGFAGMSSATFGPYGGGDARWAEIRSCVQDQFSRFNVIVTDVEPAGGEYVEAVFGGNGAELNMSSYGGVAPIDSGTCTVISSAVVYIFTQNLGTSSQVACEVAAQEIAHAFSLDHEFLCSDPMTYLSGCGAKSFQDVDAQCGEYEARDCICGRPSQNSVQVLIDKLGAASGVPTPPPTDPTDPPTDPTPPPPPPPPPTDSCGGIDYYGVCDAAGTLTWCEGGSLHTIDCAAGGMACGWQDDSIGNNCLPDAPPPPSDPPPDPCGGIDYYGVCDAAGTLTWCEGGALYSVNCASYGMSCGWQDDTIGNNCL